MTTEQQFNLNNLCNYILSVIAGVVELSDYEENMIRGMITNIRQGAPNTKQALNDSIENVINSRSDVNYILIKMRERRREIQQEYNLHYDKGFTQLTKQNRPSRQAIESELHYINETLKEYRDKLEVMDYVIEFLTSELNTLDKKHKHLENKKFDIM